MDELDIDDPQVAEKAEKLARLMGKSVAEVVSAALDQALEAARHEKPSLNESPSGS
jgi:hypothetical protein